MSEEQPTESNPPAPLKPRGRRGRRGGRGRRRSPRESAGTAPEEISATSPVEEPVAPPPNPREEIQTPVPSRQTESAAAAVSKAVDEVRQIVESLEHALEQMEEVLRLVELAERQKFADEREIESLRRALRKFQPPRARSEERPQPEN